MDTRVKHWFKHFRAHQAKCAMDGGGAVTVFPSGRTERSFGSAPYGEHAVSAFASAKAHVHFMDRMKADVAEHKRRSRAAKKGWKARRSAA